VARGKYLSLEEAYKLDRLDQFCTEHPSTGDWDRFWRLADAMANGEPPSPRRTAKALRTSSRGSSEGYSGTRTRPGTSEDAS